MNHHFTTTKANIVNLGGKVIKVIGDEGLKTTSNAPFKGNFDLEKFRVAIEKLVSVMLLL
jgi:tryptophanase